MKRKNIDRILAGILAVVLLAGAAGISTAYTFEIAYFDVAEVSMLHPAMQEAQDKLYEEEERLLSQFEQMDQEAQMMQQEMLYQELEEIRRALVNEAISKISEDVDIIAGELGYDYILDKNVIFAGGDDITEQVVEWIREEYDLGIETHGLFE